MKKIFSLLVLTVMLFAGSAWADRAQYVPDIVVTEPGAVWTDSRGFTSLDLAIDAMNAKSGGGILLVANRTSNTITTTTIDPDVVLKFTPGSIIHVPTGVTLTIEGRVDAGRYQLFDDDDGVGTVVFDISSGNSNNDVAYPEWWGALHDGSIDDTAEIQSALDCGIKTIELFTPQLAGEVDSDSTSKYKISSALTFKSKNITLRGSKTHIRPELWQQDLDVPIISSKYAYSVIQGITMSYNGTPISGASAIYLYSSSPNNADGSSILDVRIANSYNAIEIMGSPNVKINHVNLASFVNCGIYAYGVSDNLYVSDFILNAGNNFNCGGGTESIPADAVNCAGGVAHENKNGGSGAIRLYGQVASAMFTRGAIVQTTYGLVSVGGSNKWNDCPSGVHFTDVFFDSCFGGNLISNGNNLVFSNCWFSTNTGSSASTAAGVTLSSGVDINFNNCDFFNTGGMGLYVVDSNMLNVEGCRFTSIGGNYRYNPANSYQGITISAGVDNFTIRNNTFQTNGSYSTGNMNYALYIAAGVSDNYIVSGNNFGQDRIIYSTGTVTVVNGDATVTGAGTTWTSAMVGGTIQIAGVAYLVASVTSTTELELTTVYAGGGSSGLSYKLWEGNGYSSYTTDAVLDASTGHKIYVGNLMDSDGWDVTVPVSTELTVPIVGNVFNVTLASHDIAAIYCGYTSGNYAPAGHIITLKFVDATADVKDNAVIVLNGGADFTPAAGDTLTLVNIDSVWYEVSRSVN